MNERWPRLPIFILGSMLLVWSLFMSLSTHLVPPGKIIDLELARTGNEVRVVICEGDTRVNEGPVRWNTHLDFVLIPLYMTVLIFFSLQSLNAGMRPFAWLGALLAVLAGAFDIRENLGIIGALGSTFTCSFSDEAALRISHSSSIKWTLLFVAMGIVGTRLVVTQKRIPLLAISGIVLALSGIIGFPGLNSHQPDLSVVGFGISVVIVLVQFLIDRTTAGKVSK